MRHLLLNIKQSSTHEPGFVLVSVIWIAGLLAVMATAFTIGIRSYTLAGRNVIQGERAQAIADGMVMLAAYKLASEDLLGSPHVAAGAAELCQWSTSATVSVTIQEQAGEQRRPGDAGQLGGAAGCNPCLVEALTGDGDELDEHGEPGERNDAAVVGVDLGQERQGDGEAPPDEHRAEVERHEASTQGQGALAAGPDAAERSVGVLDRELDDLSRAVTRARLELGRTSSDVRPRGRLGSRSRRQRCISAHPSPFPSQPQRETASEDAWSRCDPSCEGPSPRLFVQQNT